MPLLSANQTLIDDFLRVVEPFETAYVHPTFSYIAIRSGDRFSILRASLYLYAALPQLALLSFQSPSLRAGRFFLEKGLSIRSFIDNLLAQTITTPEGTLYFEPSENGGYSLSFVPVHPDGIQAQLRFSVLTLEGGPIAEIHQPELDWEIKAAILPYDGLQELTNELALSGLPDSKATIEIVAFNIGFFDRQRSKLSGTKAEVCLVLSRELPRDRARLGYRCYAPNTATNRGVILADKMEWSDDDQFQHGRTTLDVPPAAVINCTLTYDGIAQAHYWLVDPENSQNPRRAAYEAFDPKLEGLQASIEKASVRGQDARQFESAVAVLLWLLGFNVVHLALPRTRDAADVLAATPIGHLAVVECTTGLLKAENKLALLHARTEAVRRSLVASNNTYQRVLPVIVTTRSSNDVKADMEAAERLGVVVITREALQDLLDRSLIQPNADQMYTQAEQAVTTALARYRS